MLQQIIFIFDEHALAQGSEWGIYSHNVAHPFPLL